MKQSATINEPVLVTTFAAACKVAGYDPATIIPDMSAYPVKRRAALVAFAKLMIIAEVLNGGWIPNWDDSTELKYFCWFDMDQPGFRLHAVFSENTFCYSCCGSQICFKTMALAEHAAHHFLDLYRDLMVAPNS